MSRPELASGAGAGPESGLSTSSHQPSSRKERRAGTRPQTGFKLWKFFPHPCLYLELRSCAIYDPVMDSHEAKPCFPISLQKLSPGFEKMGVLGSFPVLSGFQNVFLSCCEVPKLKHVSSQVHRTPNSSKCQQRGPWAFRVPCGEHRLPGKEGDSQNSPSIPLPVPLIGF